MWVSALQFYKMRISKIKELVNKYVKKRDFDKVNTIFYEIEKRRMINVIPSNIKLRERSKLIENEFLIKDGKEIIISGGGRIALFLILDCGLETEIKRIVQFRNFGSLNQMIYLIRKLNYFGLRTKDFNKYKLIENRN